MLYVTTKQRRNPVTSYKPLISDAGEDGGCYLPFRIEPLPWVDTIEELSFSQAVSNILNYFFSAKLNAWDIESGIGRSTCRIAALSSKMLVAETWHNPGFSYGYITERIYASLCEEHKIKGRPTFWVRVVTRVAVIFGLYADAVKSHYICKSEQLDIALSGDDLTDLIACYYAKILGLPIGMILCGSQSGQLWDLIQRGVINTQQLSPEAIRFAEWLLAVMENGQTTTSTSDKGKQEKQLYLESNTLASLQKVFFAAVISHERITSVINSVFRTDSCVINANTAAAYGAIQDYRTKAGFGNTTLLFADCVPSAQADIIKKATGITDSVLSDYCQ